MALLDGDQRRVKVSSTCADDPHSQPGVEKVPVPALQPGEIVIMDNLFSHKGPSVRAMDETAGASMRDLPL
jgi:hypothetical protein